MYTPLEDAKEEVQKRWNNAALRREVALYLGDIPEPFINEPRAVLWRNIVSYDLEFCEFLRAAEVIKLEPLGLEYHEDLFCTRNADKNCLCKLSVYHGKNGNSDAIIKHFKVVDMKSADNHKFSQLKTLWNESLIDFHHRLLSKNAPDIKPFDLSAWITSKGKKAKEYYEYFLSLFVRNGVLFETFGIDGKESGFTQDVVLPAFEKVAQRFGVNPLVCPVIPPEEVSNDYWWCYPDCVEAVIPSFGEPCYFFERAEIRKRFGKRTDH